MFFFSCSEARYHLAASYYVLREYELDLLKRRSDKDFVAEWANLQKYYADLGKYWIKYGLFLFDASRRSLPSNESDMAINDILIKSFKESLPRKSYHSINKNLKEKLQTIEENPEDLNEIPSNQELAPNNEESTRPVVEFINTNTNNSNNAEQQKQDDECKDEMKQNKEKEDLAEKHKTHEDVAEITSSLIDLIDDRLKDEDNDRKYCVAKYISMLDHHLNNHDREEKVVKNGGKDSSNYEFAFPTLPLGDIESKVTDALVTTLDGARKLFLFTQEWVKRSKAYYCIQDYPLDYVNLVLDLNDLYRYLSLYETSIELQYDVQKRRVDLLEKLTQILKEYRPQFYLMLNIELVNELTQAQIELILLNLRRLNSAPSPAHHKEDIYRRMEALLDIRKRLSRKESHVTYSASKMVTSINEPETT